MSSDNPTDSSIHIYTGPWINWSRGLIYGSTISLSSRDSQLLSSFIAALITLVGVQLWKIICYAIHQSFSKRSATDGLESQRQAIFRNSASAGGAAWSFYQQFLNWRSHSPRALLRTLPWALFAVIYLAAFSILSIFASTAITKFQGNERLIRGPKGSCGHLSNNLNSSNEIGLQLWGRKQLNDSFTAAEYAKNCYGGNHNSLACGTYPQPSLSYKVNQNASCPFQKGICKISDTAAFEMDTGLLDTHEDLGINAPQSERIKYRKLTTCAPLQTKNFEDGALEQFVPYSEQNENSKGTPGDWIAEYYYGPNMGTGGNATFSSNNHTSIDGSGYALEVLSAYVGTDPSGSVWSPIPALNRTDADVELLSIQFNSLLFFEPCDDPAFSSHVVSTVNSPDPSTPDLTLYSPDSPMSFIACSHQHQICKDPNSCTVLHGSSYILDEVQNLGLSEVQLNTTERIFQPAQSTGFYYAVSGRSAAALVAQQTVNDQFQDPLPNNQWMLEVSSWFNTGLAMLQKGVQDYASGPPAIPEGWSIKPPENTVQRAMCYNQIVRMANGTVNFSVLGLAILVIISFLIILFSWFQETIVGYLQLSIFHRGEHARLHWILDNVFQLQRIAYEAQGLGTWKNREGAIPVSDRNDRFGAWEDIADPNDHRVSKRFGSYGGKSFEEVKGGQVDTSYRGSDTVSHEGRPFMESERSPTVTTAVV